MTPLEYALLGHSTPRRLPRAGPDGSAARALRHVWIGLRARMSWRIAMASGHRELQGPSRSSEVGGKRVARDAP